ncbi:hypothetical protein H3146_25115 [Streptomyces sp. OF3]|uniref:WXG100 family type VII secretion target n=1 Tax=Streptomyces alkaliterrae TaxID=2213162 RepID=A0A7W3ZQH9_9ACTN|nr:hypothetical protein [Streptomyces alkaliterrae]MBB1256602.1 hypothetical protein [Streptomyces alkaliterrae]
MSFSVRSADIDGFGAMVDRAAVHMDHAKSFADRLPDLKLSASMSELWGTVAELHTEHRDKASTALKAYRRALVASGAELAKSARYYAETDEKEAASLDATYPASKRGPRPQPTLGGAAESGLLFQDAEDPLATFARSGDPHFFERLVMKQRVDTLLDNFSVDDGLVFLREAVGNVLDFSSPSVIINEVIYVFTGQNLLDKMAQWVTGDWGTFETCAKGWLSLAEFSSSVSKNLKTGNKTLSASWNGNAADAAWIYFDSLAKQLEEASATFRELYGHYNKIAEQIAGFVNHLKATASLIMDLAIMIFLEMILASKAAASVVGAFMAAAFMAAAAYKAVRIVSLYQNAEIALLGLFVTLNAARQTGTEQLEQKIREIGAFPLPGKGYDHRAV